MQQRINPIVRFAVDRRITMAMAVVGAVVLGWLSLSRLPLEYLPSFGSSSISVRVPYESSSPEEVARLLVRPLEDIFGTINGVKTISATASASSASVDLEFVDGTDMDLAAVEVRDRIDRVRNELPDDVERVYVRRFQSTDIPILMFSLSADWDRDRLYYFFEDVVRRRLDRLEGVAEVDSRGLQTRELQVNLLPTRMAAHGIGVQDLVTTLRDNHVNLSAGHIREGSRKLLVRSMGELDSVSRIEGLPLDDRGLELRDVARVEYDFPRRDEFNFLNGSEALSVVIRKASTANLLQVVERVKGEMEAIRGLPGAEGLHLHYFRDSSQDVLKGLSQLRNSGLLGGGLAILFMFLFLRRFRTTLLVAIAIPVSIVVTFVMMFLGRQSGLADITVNIFSLMGLMLAVGMLVDNAIVVIESIFRHRQDLRREARTAALIGTSEVALPIFASTLTTICVFFPLIFLQQGGRFGIFMSNIGISVCVVMVASLLVSLTVVPMIAGVVLSGEKRKAYPLFDRVVRVYGVLLRLTLRHRFLVIVVSLALLGGSILVVMQTERSYGAESMERQIPIYVDLPRHYTLEQTASLYQDLYEIFDQRREELEIADITYRYRRGGGRTRSGFGGSNRFEIYLVDEEESKAPTAEIREKVRSLLPVVPGVEFNMRQSFRGPPGMSGPLEVELSGEDMELLEMLSDQVREFLVAAPMVKGVDTSLESGDEEIHVGVNRERALQAGLSTQAVARTISSALTSRPVSYVKSEEREVGLVVQYREEDRETLDQLKKLQVRTGEGGLPISSLAGFELRPGPQTIRRENRRSRVTVEVDTGDVPGFAMMGSVRGLMSEISLPPGYEWGFGRWFREGRMDERGAMFAFLFALPLIYMIMCALFEHFAQPFTIMFAVPFSFIGVGVVLRLGSQPRSPATDMGLIILAGIVVNNAIVLIDHINRLRREGMGRHEAIVLGGQHRLRPIIMTAVTTILGLSPMVAPFFLPEIFGRPEGRAAFWAPVGLVILGGLTTSTFLTLLIIPTIYSLVDDGTRFLKRVLRAAAMRPPSAARRPVT